MIRKDNKTLKEIIGNDTHTALENELAAINPALNTAVFEKLNIWAIAASLPILKNQLEGKKALDFQLYARASKAGKKLKALETYEQQLGAFSTTTQQEQTIFLKDTLQIMKLHREKKLSVYGNMINKYLLGDTEAVIKEMRKTEVLGYKINKAVVDKLLVNLLINRNKGMADTIQKELSQPAATTNFFAAGAAHYIGQGSVNELLTQAGYQVTRVQ